MREWGERCSTFFTLAAEFVERMRQMLHTCNLLHDGSQTLSDQTDPQRGQSGNSLDHLFQNEIKTLDLWQSKMVWYSVLWSWQVSWQMMANAFVWAQQNHGIQQRRYFQRLFLRSSCHIPFAVWTHCPQHWVCLETGILTAKTSWVQQIFKAKSCYFWVSD